MKKHKNGRVSEARCSMRPLRARAYLLLVTLNHVEQPAARVAPAAYLLAELQGHVERLDSPAPRPAPAGLCQECLLIGPCSLCTSPHTLLDC